jgi:pyruvate kinase
VLALTPDPLTERQLTISWGISPVLVSSFKNVDEIFALAKSWAIENNIAGKGDRLVVTAGVPVGEPGTTNLLKVLQVD